MATWVSINLCVNYLGSLAYIECEGQVDDNILTLSDATLTGMLDCQVTDEDRRWFQSGSFRSGRPVSGATRMCVRLDPAEVENTYADELYAELPGAMARDEEDAA